MSYTKNEIAQVWQMAKTVQGFDPNFVRQDVCGALIEFVNYGNRNSAYGWEIDHIIPLSKGGAHSYANVQPLASKGDGLLVCSTTPGTGYGASY